MMNKQVIDEVIIVIKSIRENGPQWKHGKDIFHLTKRIARGHISESSTLDDYNAKIIEICSIEDSELYVYYKKTFLQNYYVIGDGTWIVIVGKDKIMETAFPPDDYSRYLSEKDGYNYIGTLKEVLDHEH